MYQAFTCLLIAMPKYNKQLKQFCLLNARQQSAFKFSGYLLLISSLFLLVEVSGLSNGIVWFFAIFTLSGSVLALLFSFLPELAILPVRIFVVLRSPDKRLHFSPIFLLCFYAVPTLFFMVNF